MFDCHAGLCAALCLLSNPKVFVATSPSQLICDRAYQGALLLYQYLQNRVFGNLVPIDLWEEEL